MRTTINIDDELLERAARLPGTTQTTALVRRGLEALIAQASARRLSALGGSEKKLKAHSAAPITVAMSVILADTSVWRSSKLSRRRRPCRRTGCLT